MDRIKTYDATGVAPNGRLYAGDLNLLQDMVAALTDLTQNLSVGSLAVGAADTTLTYYGPQEIAASGSFRTLGAVRAAGGLLSGSYTTAQRDAIVNPDYGLAVLNTSTNQYEWNSGTPAAPSWKPLGIDGAGNSIIPVGSLRLGGTAGGYNVKSIVLDDVNPATQLPGVITGGSVLYSDAGAPKWRGAGLNGGNIVGLAPLISPLFTTQISIGNTVITAAGAITAPSGESISPNSGVEWQIKGNGRGYLLVGGSTAMVGINTEAGKYGIGITNSSANPTLGGTVGGGMLFAVGGALKWLGSGGTITTIAPA